MLALLRKHGWPISVALAGAGGLAFAVVTSMPPPPFKPLSPGDDGLPRMGSEAQFRGFLAQRNALVRARYSGASSDMVMLDAPAAEAAAPADSITNVQEAGVDEGGIVKAVGDKLVILRRGRLFTISTADGGLRSLDSIDVSPPATRPSGNEWDGAWYDEMLVVGDRVVVIGYSYEKQGSEILRFRLAANGRLTFEDASRLTASDYFSSENYASRLIGDQLVFYNVRALEGEGPADVLPALIDETPGRVGSRQSLTRPEDVFIDPRARPSNLAFSALHSITRCDLTAPRLACEATAVIGPWSRTFYVSPRAVYLWTAATGQNGDRVPATVYRMPLGGGRPQAVRVAGAPLDQFSFREDMGRGRLDVLVLSDDGGGDAMWARESRDGAAALLSLPLDRFGDGDERAVRADYRDLPDVRNVGWQRHNRFVGDHLLYGVQRMRDGRYDDSTGELFALDLDGGPVRTFDFDAPISRIEALGPDALIVTENDAGIALTALDLAGGAASLGARYALSGAGEAESRSHGFYFRADGPGLRSGLLGLPTLRSSQNPAEVSGDYGEMDMLFLRRGPETLSLAGRLPASRGRRPDDHCRVSCVDWYGSARPIFLRGRIFALMGYELVEGRMEGRAIREAARLDFTPSA